MRSQSQISATISEATKERLDRFTESHGLKKNFVVEQALLYFMDARRELPDEALLPARLVVEDRAFDRIAELMENPPAPAKALRELMRGEDDSDSFPRQGRRPQRLLMWAARPRQLLRALRRPERVGPSVLDSGSGRRHAK
jgi:uncharacterized protein (DUF1778 family)